MSATGRWQVGLVVALAAVAIGVVVGNTTLLASAVVGLSYAAYGHATPPPPNELSVERIVDPRSAMPGEVVDVVVHVTNEGATPIADVRIVDEPPTGLPVEGVARTATSVQPGETASLRYGLRARRGTHEFGDVVLVARNVSGAVESRSRHTLDDVVDCDDPPGRLPLPGQTIQNAGRVEADVGGDGVEFYSTRAYHPTDPMNRVDWKQLARTGELTTIEFREERATNVVVVADVRGVNAVARDHGELDGVDLTRHATEWIAESLLAESNRVGVALYGGSGNYLLPRTGRAQLARVRQLLDGEWCGSYGRSGWLSRGNAHVGRFCRHLADEKQLVFVTAAIDDAPVESARRFRAYGHAVTVISPSIVETGTPGSALERIDRERRLSELRSHGVRSIEWSPDEALSVAIDRADRRWSR